MNACARVATFIQPVMPPMFDLTAWNTPPLGQAGCRRSFIVTSTSRESQPLSKSMLCAHASGCGKSTLPRRSASVFAKGSLFTRRMQPRANARKARAMRNSDVGDGQRRKHVTHVQIRAACEDSLPARITAQICLSQHACSRTEAAAASTSSSSTAEALACAMARPPSSRMRA